jgi:hypothetical protein
MNTATVSENLPEDRFHPDAPCDASQRNQLPRAAPATLDADTPPEHRLMIAIFRDAIRCIEKNRNARDFRGRRLFQQDAQWTLSDDTGWVHAFARVCETLDLEPNAVRSALGLLPTRAPALSGRRVRRPVSTLHPRSLS